MFKIFLKFIAIFLFLSNSIVFAADKDQVCKTSNSFEASIASDRLKDNENGTITDTLTNLMWKKCNEGQNYAPEDVLLEGVYKGTCTGDYPKKYTWLQALNLAATYRTNGYAGFNDWRLPNIKELSSIVERRCVNPAVSTKPDIPVSSTTVSAYYFPKPQTYEEGTKTYYYYWSSTHSTMTPANALAMDFYYGYQKDVPETTECIIRLVRTIK